MITVETRIDDKRLVKVEEQEKGMTSIYVHDRNSSALLNNLSDGEFNEIYNAMRFYFQNKNFK